MTENVNIKDRRLLWISPMSVDVEHEGKEDTIKFPIRTKIDYKVAEKEIDVKGFGTSLNRVLSNTIFTYFSVLKKRFEKTTEYTGSSLRYLTSQFRDVLEAKEALFVILSHGFPNTGYFWDCSSEKYGVLLPSVSAVHRFPFRHFLWTPDKLLYGTPDKNDNGELIFPGLLELIEKSENVTNVKIVVAHCYGVYFADGLEQIIGLIENKTKYVPKKEQASPEPLAKIVEEEGEDEGSSEDGYRAKRRTENSNGSQIKNLKNQNVTVEVHGLSRDVTTANGAESLFDPVCSIVYIPKLKDWFTKNYELEDSDFLDEGALVHGVGRAM